MKNYSINKNLIIQKTDDGISIFDPEHSQLFTLNSSASYILKKIQRKVQIEDIVMSITKHYKVSENQASKHVSDCISYLLNEHIIH